MKDGFLLDLEDDELARGLGFDLLDDDEDGARGEVAVPDVGAFAPQIADASDRVNHQEPRNVPVQDDRPAEVRLDELMGRLGSQRKTALGILVLCCDAPQPNETLARQVAHEQEKNFSVLDAATLCGLLERAGGLSRVTAEGDPYPADAGEPELVERDGARYYEVRPAPAVYWAAAPAGAALAAADDPARALRELLDAEPQYRDVYAEVLGRCAAEGGTAMKVLDREFKDHPLLQEPRRYASYFIDRLEEAGGVEWTGAWSATPTGLAYLDEMVSA